VKVSLEEQAALLVKAQEQLGPVGEGLITPALRTLRWLAANKATLDLCVRTVQSEAVRNVMDTFPGATIESIGWTDDDTGHKSQDY